MPNKVICSCCNGDTEVIDGKLVNHDREGAGICEGSGKTPEELKACKCSEAKD